MDGVTPGFGQVGSTRRIWLTMAGIAMATLLAYSNAFRGQFMLDDLSEIADNPAIHRLLPPVEVMTRGHRLAARPLPYLTFAIDHAIWGADPAGYHVANILIHAISALALFSLALITLTSPRVRGRFGDHALPLAAVTALVWAVHPLHTKSVTYVYQRIEALCGMFSLVSLTCFALAAFGGWNRRWLAASVAAAAAAMLSKENAVALPLLVLAYDWCFVARDAADLRSRWRIHAALAATWLLVAAQVWMQSAVYGEFLEKPHGVLEYALTQPGVMLRYLRLTFWPYGQQIMYDWPIARRVGDWLPQTVALAVPLVLTVVGLSRRAPWAWLGCAFFLALAPTSSFMPVKAPISETRMYLPLAAVLAAIVVGLHALGSRGVADRASQDRPVWPWLAAASAAVVALWLSCLTYARNAAYHDRTGFWVELLERDPDNSFAHAGLAQIRAAEGDAEAAIEHARHASRTAPESDALGHLAATILRQGDEPRAEALMDEAIRTLEASLPPASRATLLARQSRANMDHDRRRFSAAEAICSRQLADMDRVLGRSHTATISARTILARAAVERGDLAEAERLCRENLAAAMRSPGPGEPVTQEAATTLSQVLYATDRKDEAERIQRDLISAAEAIAWRHTPDLQVAWRTLAGMLETEGRHAEAADVRQAMLVDCARRFGENDPQTIRAAVQLGRCRTAVARAKEDPAAAEQSARKGLGLALAGLGVGDGVTQAAAADYAGILLAAGRDADAEEVLRTFLAEVAATKPAASSRPIDATLVQRSLAELLEKTGRPEEALKVRRLILRFLLKLRGPDDRLTQEAAQIVKQAVERGDAPAASVPAAE